jgi:hypothetical protein
MPPQEWIDPFARFEVVLAAVGDRTPVVLRSAPDADPAMLAFYDEWERLRHEHVAGELLLVYRGDEARTLLREPLG